MRYTLHYYQAQLYELEADELEAIAAYLQNIIPVKGTLHDLRPPARAVRREGKQKQWMQ